MLKVLLQLVVILFISATIGQQTLLPLLNETLFEREMDWALKFLHRGSIDILANELNNDNDQQKPLALSSYQQQFGFKIDLLTIDSFTPAQKNTLSSGELLTDVESLSVYKILKNKKDVLAFKYTESPAPHIIAEAQWRIMGTINTLKHQLTKLPEQQWKTEIERLNQYFDFEIKLALIETLSLNEKQMSQLLNNKVAWQESEYSIDIEFPLEKAFYKMPSSSFIIVLGPISQPFSEKVAPAILWYYFALSLVILVPIAIWMYPTWLSIKRLSKASDSFGRGDFSSRVVEVTGNNIKNYVRTFNQMAEKIEGLISVNKSLVNAVSHELRTPLSRIEFDLEMARTSKDKESQGILHDRIESSVDELKNLVNEMLLYAKFDQEKPTLNFEALDLNAWLHSNLESWEIKGLNRSITVTPNPLRHVTTLDRYYMNRVMSNLVRNALKYSDSRVCVSSGSNEEKSFIIVEDDGSGIDMSDRNIIFNAFVRLDKSRNRDTGGTGLGLAIVKQIMIWHKGTVTISDSSLGGAKFTVSWPNSSINERLN